MDNLSNSGSVLAGSFAEIWSKFMSLVPSLIGAVLIFIVGIVIAKALGRLVAKLINKIYVDRAIEMTGAKKVLEKVGFRIQVSQALGLLITWFLYAVVLVAAADMLGLSEISEFLRQVVMYIPNVIIAVVILIVGMVVGNFVFTLVKETALAAELESADFLAGVAKWALFIFTLMAALIQLKVASELIQILFTGLVFMVALAGGIAFGLGGKDKAERILEKLMKK